MPSPFHSGLSCAHASRTMMVFATAVLWLAWPAADAISAEPSKISFQREIQPILVKLCVDCHGAESQEGDLRIDTLNADLVNGRDAETWHDILNKLNVGEMPPEDADQPSDAQRQALVNWLTSELARAARAQRSTGRRVVLRRLTRYEYHNTMRDLLGVELDYARNLPPEPPSADGFLNNGAALGISPLQIEYYLRAARRGLGAAIVTGEKPRVFTHHAEKSEKVRRVKGVVGNDLIPGARFLVRMKEFPREGEVLVRVKASAKIEPNAAYPQMRVALGVRADVRAPEKTLAMADVLPGEPQVFEFRGRIEEFPLPGHRPKFPGLQVSIYNEAETPPGKQPKKGKGKSADPNAQGAPKASIIHIHSVDFEGPILTSWPPPSHQRIFIESDAQENEEAYAREIIERFATRAYRRPATADDVLPVLAMFNKLRPKADSFEAAIRDALALVLISPDFLYLSEPREGDERTPLSQYELASRLSYFLWSSMPDEELLRLASEKQLASKGVLAKQVKRMIADPKSGELVRNFTDQWLDLSGVNRVAINPQFHPKFDDRLKTDMQAETRAFFAEILRSDASCLQLLDADFAMLNRRLAKHYGVEGPQGTQLQRVAVTDEHRRAGILTQGSFLLANANGEDSHPIKRAVWVLDRLLDSPPAPPPPDVPDLDSDSKELAGLSLKEQLKLHREKQACNSCHRGIDPWGVAFENYDAVGRWRTQVQARGRGKPTPVDATAELPDGNQVTGVAELKQYLLTHRKQQFARSLVKRLLTYGLGRSLEWGDEETVQRLTQEFLKNNLRPQALIVAIVSSEEFQTK